MLDSLIAEPLLVSKKQQIKKDAGGW